MKTVPSAIQFTLGGFFAFTHFVVRRVCDAYRYFQSQELGGGFGRPSCGAGADRKRAAPGLFAGRTILVDGTNVCFWSLRSGKKGSLAPLLALIEAIDEEGADWMACFDASTRHHLAGKGRSDAAAYERLLRTRPDRFAVAPYADIFLLEAAKKKPDSVIISNDRFRNHARRFPFVQDKNRVAAGNVFRGELRVPDLGIRHLLANGAITDAVDRFLAPRDPSGVRLCSA